MLVHILMYKKESFLLHTHHILTLRRTDRPNHLGWYLWPGVERGCFLPLLLPGQQKASGEQPPQGLFTIGAASLACCQSCLLRHQGRCRLQNAGERCKGPFLICVIIHHQKGLETKHAAYAQRAVIATGVPSCHHLAVTATSSPCLGVLCQGHGITLALVQEIGTPAGPEQLLNSSLCALRASGRRPRTRYSSTRYRPDGSPFCMRSRSHSTSICRGIHVSRCFCCFIAVLQETGSCRGHA